MDITLVTSSYDKVVHGTENDKKTGCGINLLKPENVTRFHRTSRMTDLKEITCEKCKANLAKKLIKADKKEMALLLKEEKKREKMGLVDEGIVPLGNTTAKITRDPEAKRKEEEAKQRAAEEARRAAEEARRAAEEAAAEEAAQYEPEVPVNTIPGTSVPIDESLSEFAISIPTEEETPSNDDDFLAQFAIQKPDEVAASPSSQSASVVPEDDFLAQFAIPAPQSSPLPEDPAANMYYNEEPEEMDGLDVKPASAYGQPAYNQPVYNQPEYGQPANVQTEDIMKMFSIDNSPVNEPAYNQPAYEQPAYEQPAYNQPVYEQPAYNQPAYEQQGYGQPNMYTESVPAQEMAQSTELNDAAEVMAYNNNYGAPNYEEPTPVYLQYDMNQPKEMDELPFPAMGENPASPVSNIPPAHTFDELPTVEEQPAPVVNETVAAAPINEPKLDEITSVPNMNGTAYNGVPAVPETTAPAFDEIPAVPNIAAPVNADIPVVPDMSAPVLDDISAPILNMPSMAGQENNDMSDYNYVAPGTGAEPNVPKHEPEKPVQPQVIKVPQFAGYDANNQPVYKYVQMKLVGVDQKGQPVYVPVQGQQPQAQAQPVQQARPQAPAQPQRPVQAAAPAQQTAAQAQRAAAAPVQQTPVKSVVPRRPVQQAGVPTANISKIAVNPHSKSTSQAFINAIASSKEYADKNLIETQGLKANSPVLTSIEDVLSTMGDDSAKKQKIAQAQQAVPVFDEYKAPQAAAPRRSAPSPMKAQQPEEKDVRYMTKAELKAKKKQDKIDAKFKKEMSKRGF